MNIKVMIFDEDCWRYDDVPLEYSVAAIVPTLDIAYDLIAKAWYQEALGKHTHKHYMETDEPVTFQTADDCIEFICRQDYWAKAPLQLLQSEVDLHSFDNKRLYELIKLSRLAYN